MGKLDQEKFGAYAKLYMNSKYGMFLVPVFFCTNLRRQLNKEIMITGFIFYRMVIFTAP